MKEKTCVGRCKTEREQGKMWLRLNRVQTADLKMTEFTDPYVAREVKKAVDDGRHFADKTLVLFTPPRVARAILLWSEGQGTTSVAHRLGARADVS